MSIRGWTKAIAAALMALGIASQAMADTANGGCVVAATTCTIGTVPEPGALELLGIGLAGAIAVRLIARRRK